MQSLSAIGQVDFLVYLHRHWSMVNHQNSVSTLLSTRRQLTLYLNKLVPRDSTPDCGRRVHPATSMEPTCYPPYCTVQEEGAGRRDRSLTTSEVGKNQPSTILPRTRHCLSFAGEWIRISPTGGHSDQYFPGTAAKLSFPDPDRNRALLCPVRLRLYDQLRCDGEATELAIPQG